MYKDLFYQTIPSRQIYKNTEENIKIINTKNST